MRTTQFHDRMASRLAAIFGASSLAIGYATSGGACKAPPHANATSTTATSATTTSGTTSAGSGIGGAGAMTVSSGYSDVNTDPIEQQCMVWPPTDDDAMPLAFPDDGTTDPATGCPSDAATILVGLDPNMCPTGWEAQEVISGPARNAMNQCCYQVGIHLCSRWRAAFHRRGDCGHGRIRPRCDPWVGSGRSADR